MIKLPTKWNPVCWIISHKNLNTKNFSTNWILGNAAAEMSALLPVNLFESVFQFDYYEHRGTRRIWYEARQNIEKIKCWTSPRHSCFISGFKFCTSGLKSFRFHLVSKALIQTVNVKILKTPNKRLTDGSESSWRKCWRLHAEIIFSLKKRKLEPVFEVLDVIMWAVFLKL